LKEKKKFEIKKKKKESRRFTVNSGGPSTSLVFVKNENVKFVLASFTSTLCACCQGEFVSFGRQVHCDVVKLGLENGPYFCTHYLTMHSKCKLIADAENVFDQVSEKKDRIVECNYLGICC
jgi:hypothetical protein